MYNDPCEVCGVRRLDHEPSQIRHRYQTPALPPEAFYDCEFWDNLNDTTGGTVERSIMRHGEREGNGGYSAPLPSPEDRKRIRERAGLTQEDLADELLVSRWTVTRWEKPAGYRSGTRLGGREPVGQLRAAYSALLRELATAHEFSR
jgi:hypothetical protein